MPPSIATSGNSSAGVGGGDEHHLCQDAFLLPVRVPQAIVPQPHSGMQPPQAPSWPPPLHGSVEPPPGSLQAPLELRGVAELELLRSQHCSHECRTSPVCPTLACALPHPRWYPILNRQVNAHSGSEACSNATPVAGGGATTISDIMERADAQSIAALPNLQIAEHLDRAYHLIDHISLSTQQLQDIVSGEGDKQNALRGFAVGEHPTEIQRHMAASGSLLPDTPTQHINAMYQLFEPEEPDVLPPRAWSPLEASCKDAAQERMEHLPLEDAGAVVGRSVPRGSQEHEHWPDIVQDDAVEAKHVQQRAGSVKEAGIPGEPGEQHARGQGARATARDDMASLGTASGSEQLGPIKTVTGKLAPQDAARSQRSAVHEHRPMKAQRLAAPAAGLESSRQAGVFTRGVGRPREVALVGGNEEVLEKSGSMQKRMEKFEASLSGLRSIHLQVPASPPVPTACCHMEMGLCDGHCSTKRTLDRIAWILKI